MAITHAFFHLFDPFEAITDPLLTQSDFQTGSASGTGIIHPHQETGGIALSNRDLKRSAALFQTVPRPQHIDHFLLSGTIATAGVMEQEKAWKAARVIGLALDADMQRLPESYIAANMHGDHPPTRFHHAFRVPGEARHLKIGLQLAQTSGRMTVSEITLTGVQERTAYIVLKGLLAGCWVVLLCWSVVLVARQSSRSPASLFMALFATALFVGTLMSLQLKSEIFQQMERGAALTLAQIQTPPAEKRPATADSGKQSRQKSPETELLDKQKINSWSHGMLFALLTISVFSHFRTRRKALLTGFIICYAISTETLQNFAIQRTPSGSDFAIDLIGIMAGGVIWLGWQSIMPHTPAGEDAG